MIYQIKKNANNEKIPVGLTGVIGPGLPIGTLISLEDESNVPEGFLKCDGSTFDAAQYPALALYLGGNTLPYEADHSKGLDFSDATLFDTTLYGHTTLANAWEAPYDGMVFSNTSYNAAGAVYVYDSAKTTNLITQSLNSNEQTSVCSSVPFKKGQFLFVTGAANRLSSADQRLYYYKSCRFIKATL